MTEEVTNAPDATTLNLADILSGISYPKDRVTVYLNPAVAYELSKVAKLIAQGGDADRILELESIQDKLEAEGKEAALTFHLTGASRHDKENVLKSVMDEFPVENDVFGRPKNQPEADEVYANRRWALHIEKIEYSNGASIENPSAADLNVFRGQAPDFSVDQVERAIVALESGEKSGFESLAQGHDFLSQP